MAILIFCQNKNVNGSPGGRHDNYSIVFFRNKSDIGLMIERSVMPFKWFCVYTKQSKQAFVNSASLFRFMEIYTCVLLSIIIYDSTRNFYYGLIRVLFDVVKNNVN